VPSSAKRARRGQRKENNFLIGSLTVVREGGAWEIGMSAGKSPGNVIKGRGVGATFGAAWDDITGLQFDR
jgi:hypothetical protein